MSKEHSATSYEEQTPDNRCIAPTRLDLAIQGVMKREQMQEAFAETVIYAYPKEGMVSIPRSNAKYATDKDRVLITGTDDYAFKSFIEGPLRKLFENITSSEEILWKHVAAGRKKGVLVGPVRELTKLGQQIVLCCRMYEPAWAAAYVHHVFDPSTTIMLRGMKNLAWQISRHGDPGKLITQDGELIRALERLTRFIRRVSKTWQFINALNAHKRQEEDNFNSSRDYIYYQAGRHSRLLILRLDLYFKPYFEVERANNEIDSFLRWLRSPACKRNLLPSYLGFLIKRENGLVRGMHWHVMIICKGNEQRSTDYLTRQLGEQWALRTRQGPGSYHNCYADRDRYEFNGLGMLELHDWEKMAGLRAAIWYMSKQSCVIKATNSKVKNFWRSPIPRKARKKLGRRREAADPLKLLQRMLDGARSTYPPGAGPGTWSGRR